MTTLTDRVLVAEVAWPQISLDANQLDWIDHMFILEAWLNHNVADWRWAGSLRGGLAVQFQRPQDLAWFQLRWL